MSPEGAGFAYTILLRNRSLASALSLSPRNGERVQQLDAALSCEQQSGTMAAMFRRVNTP